jgi:nitrite reductase/ring-hydroxylating ferredoxin subunit
MRSHKAMLPERQHLAIVLVLIHALYQADSFLQFAPTKSMASTASAACRIKAISPIRRVPTALISKSSSPSPTDEAVDEKLKEDVDSLYDHTPFDFHKHWYPIAVPEFLDPKKPHPVQLLGKDLVIWKDTKSGSWKVFEDACPHRLAPLSEGRVEPDGTILCAYHAWRFDGNGQCTSIPQSRKEKEQEHCALPKSCAVPHPTMERQGLLWVWGQPGGPGSDAAILSKSAPPPAHRPPASPLRTRAWAAHRGPSKRGMPSTRPTPRHSCTKQPPCRRAKEEWKPEGRRGCEADTGRSKH